MSSFSVSVERIERVWAHSNADRLELAKLESQEYQFVIAKDQFKAGDIVVYFPIDSILPQELVEKLGLTGKLSGSQHNRVKTVKLRGETSQGIVGNIIFLPENTPYGVGTDVTELLGVTKYEPQEHIMNSGAWGKAKRSTLPTEVRHYDIENAEKYKKLIEQYLMYDHVYITEKLEGSHFAININKDKQISVCSRNQKIEKLEGQNHLWLQVAESIGAIDAIKEIQQRYAITHNQKLFSITLRGELIGEKVQGNIYHLTGNDVYFFELEVDGEPQNFMHLVMMCALVGLKHVPVVSKGLLYEILGEQSLAQYSNGQSELFPTLREGIVIKPGIETYDEKFGRVFLKQRSPEYLVKEK